MKSQTARANFCPQMGVQNRKNCALSQDLETLKLQICSPDGFIHNSLKSQTSSNVEHEIYWMECFFAESGDVIFLIEAHLIEIAKYFFICYVNSSFIQNLHKWGHYLSNHFISIKIFIIANLEPQNINEYFCGK